MSGRLQRLLAWKSALGMASISVDWRENLIPNHKAEIARLREEIEFERTNPQELSEEIISDNLRVIATLEAIKACTEASD